MVDFWLVYIREAHAIDSFWAMGSPDGSVVEQPITVEERCASARHCKEALGLGAIPALVDSLEDDAERAYEAWPDRMVLIDGEGRVAWASPPGPFGFDPNELRQAIRREMKRVRAATDLP